MVRTMRTNGIASVAVVLLVGAGLGQAVAQDANSPFEGMREGVPTSRDNAIVDEWIEAKLDRLRTALADPQADVHKYRKAFLSAITKEYSDARNSVDFKGKLADRVSEAFRVELTKTAEARNINVSRAVAQALVELKSARTREAALAGLAVSDQVVRYLSAKALMEAREGIAADARLAGATLEQIGDLGKVEVNGVVRGMLYRAASYENYVAEAVPAVLKIIDGRLEALRTGAVEWDRAELFACQYLDSLELDSVLKAEVVRRFAPLLRIHTVGYGNAGLTTDERWIIQETIDACESLLAKVVAPNRAPQVSSKMQAGGDSASIEMQLELIKWIGTKDEAGILNGAPWNVERGAP